MKKYLLKILLIFIFFSHLLLGDCGGSISFIETAQKADLVALVKKVDQYYFDIEMILIIEVIKGDPCNEGILVFDKSPCFTERALLRGNFGDTLLVAINKHTDEVECDTEIFRYIEKPNCRNYFTDICGNNSLIYHNGLVSGSITKRFGNIYENGEYKEYGQYDEEKMLYKVVYERITEKLNIE